MQVLKSQFNVQSSVNGIEPKQIIINIIYLLEIKIIIIIIFSHSIILTS